MQGIQVHITIFYWKKMKRTLKNKKNTILMPKTTWNLVVLHGTAWCCPHKVHPVAHSLNMLKYFSILLQLQRWCNGKCQISAVWTNGQAAVCNMLSPGSIWMAPWKNRTSRYISFFHPSLNGVLFPMFCLLLEGIVRLSDFSVLKYY